MLIDHENKIAYFSIPKVACSSLKHVMFHIINGAPWQSDTAYGDLPPARHIHMHYPSVLFDKIDHDAIKDYWKFTVVRDPIKRIFSTYVNKLADKNILERKPPRRKQSEKRHEAYAQVDKNPDLNTFCLNIRQYRRASGQIARHTLRYQRFLGEDLSYFDRIYPIESIDQLITDLQDRTGKTLKLPHRNKSSINPKLEDLDKDAFNSLRKFTRKDYALLSDFYTPPTFPGDHP